MNSINCKLAAEVAEDAPLASITALPLCWTEGMKEFENQSKSEIASLTEEFYIRHSSKSDTLLEAMITPNNHF